MWKAIMSTMDDFFKLVKFKVNNGDMVRFGLDRWCTKEPLNIIFPSCFRVAASKYGSVQDHMIRFRVNCSWDLKPRRNLNDWEIEEMGQLLDILEKYPVGGQGLEDEMIWTPDEEGGFSVASMFDALKPQKPDLFPGMCV